ncbi:calcium-binding protein [Streptomyces sp. NPDC058469]|uniref:calcium-binding protein n=1 Tax=Streptomyces sp. NPDC058469 TaxID=3346514 RepID=UPI003654B40A
MIPRLGGHRALRVAVVLTLVLALGVAVRIALHRGPEPYKGPPATARSGVYKAAPGQANHVTVTETSDGDGRVLRYAIDDVVPIAATGPGCTHPDAGDRTKAVCTVVIEEMARDPYTTFVMQLGDGDDTAAIHHHVADTLGRNEVHLGDGDDTWTGVGDDAQAVWGDDGDDTLKVSRYVDGGGDDTIHAEGEQAGGEGGPGDDVLYGGAGDQGLNGDAGDDTIYGGPGDDQLYGGVGADVLHGNSGDDIIHGDKRDGGRFDGGKDKLYGGPGTDKLDGGPADDFVQQD